MGTSNVNALTGILLTVLGGDPLKFYGLTVVLPVKASTAPWRILHATVPPVIFYTIFALHLAGVLKHHFISRRKDEVRRMLR